MFKRLFCITFLTILALATIFVYRGNTEKWKGNDFLPASVWAGTHGHAMHVFFPLPDEDLKNLKPKDEGQNNVFGRDVHIHCIAAAHDDRDGYYNVWAQVNHGDDYDGESFADSDGSMDEYEGGCRAIAVFSVKVANIGRADVIYKGRAFVKDETTGASSGEFNKNGVVRRD